MTLGDEIKRIQNDFNFSDIDMCNNLCTDMETYGAILSNRAAPTTFNLIMLICATKHPVGSIIGNRG